MPGRRPVRTQRVSRAVGAAELTRRATETRLAEEARLRRLHPHYTPSLTAPPTPTPATLPTPRRASLWKRRLGSGKSSSGRTPPCSSSRARSAGARCGRCPACHYTRLQASLHVVTSPVTCGGRLALRQMRFMAHARSNVEPLLLTDSASAPSPPRAASEAERTQQVRRHTDHMQTACTCKPHTQMPTTYGPQVLTTSRAHPEPIPSPPRAHLAAGGPRARARGVAAVAVGEGSG